MLNKRSIFLCLSLGVITLALYWPARSFNFVLFDDNEYVTQNPHVQTGLRWNGIAWAFETNYASNWHPLTWISHMLDCQLYGMNPGGHHFTSVLLHVFNVMLLYLVLLRLTDEAWPSWIVAGLFGWHPAHVESVAWISERKDVLSTFFGLLTMLSYTSFVRAGRNPKASTLYYLAALFSFALSLLSKPMLVTLPFVLMLLDYWPLRRINLARQSNAAEKASETAERQSRIKACLIEKIPFLLLALVSCVITMQAQERAVGSSPFWTHIGDVAVAYVKYLKMMLWPVNLAFFYPRTGAPPVGHVVIALMLLSALSVAALSCVRGAPYFPVGWFWFLGTLVPAIGLVQVGSQTMADRYTYFPSIGLFLIVAWALSCFLKKRERWQIALKGAMLLALGAYFVAARVQLGYWRNSFTLADHARKVTDENFAAYSVLADDAEQAGDYAKAIEYAKTSLAYEPNYASAHYLLGVACLETGRLGEAISHLSEAAALRPSAPLIYQKLGRALLAGGRFNEAFKQFSTALKMDPTDYISDSQMGIICSQG
ncbi:MAG TPA: tetratricopeptide repeat protein, partial [Verrucomicrobiae bacterium]|nr:tetratricopeptide repeat protein [Verrucomicrobiae bacterium]